jgi:hypothetical protein
MRKIAALMVGLAVIGCSDPSTDDEDEDGDDAIPECIEYELSGCSALYPPTYDQVWTQTFANGCAEVGGACHGQDGAAGAVRGLTFVDPQTTWDHLMLAGETGPLVVPGDPQCSPLFVRLATDDPAIRMPPGAAPLDPNALCSIGTWISDGAAFSQP